MTEIRHCVCCEREYTLSELGDDPTELLEDRVCPKCYGLLGTSCLGCNHLTDCPNDHESSIGCQSIEVPKKPRIVID